MAHGTCHAATLRKKVSVLIAYCVVEPNVCSFTKVRPEPSSVSHLQQPLSALALCSRAMEGILALSRSAGLASTSYSVPPCQQSRLSRANYALRTVCQSLSSRNIVTGGGWQGDLPKPADYQPGVIPGIRTIPTPVLSPSRVSIAISEWHC